MRRFFALVLGLAFAVPASACLWDYDTLQMERQRFPGALELIVGKFLRHSDRFYEWRVLDRQDRIARHESDEKPLSDKELAATYDDLAVAFDKLGRQDDAIEAIRKKAEKLPNVGEYETHANLGTFLVHSRRYEEGLAELRKAVQINPDAHFGRERYQIRVVEYLSERRDSSGRPVLPLEGSFAWWLLEREGLGDGKGTMTDEKAARAELDRAAKGILGMMRFGDFRSPILLEVLGDVLLSGQNYHDTEEAQRLAARAYLRAAEFANDPKAAESYRKMAQNALANQMPDRDAGEGSVVDGQELSLASLEDQLAREVKEADAWFKEVAHDEELWVEASPDPDKRFWDKYGNREIAIGHDRLPAGKFAAGGLPVAMRIALGAALAFTLLVVIAAMIWRKKRPTGYSGGEPQA